jgi:excisionase family DNA binding protein
MEPLAISINETAKALSIGRSSVYALLKTGRLDAIKIGRRTLLTTESIKRLSQPQPADHALPTIRNQFTG